MAKPILRLLGRRQIGCLAMVLWSITAMLVLWFFVEVQYAAMFVPRCNEFTPQHQDLDCRQLYWRVHRALRNAELSVWAAGVFTSLYFAAAVIHKWRLRRDDATTPGRV